MGPADKRIHCRARDALVVALTAFWICVDIVHWVYSLPLSLLRPFPRMPRLI